MYEVIIYLVEFNWTLDTRRIQIHHLEHWLYEKDIKFDWSYSVDDDKGENHFTYIVFKFKKKNDAMYFRLVKGN